MDTQAAFRRTIKLCFRAHPYYRELFRSLGLRPEDLATPEDLVKLPVTMKSTWMDRPEDFRLQLGDVPGVSLEEQTLWEVVYTTGSTAHPTPFYDTVHDHYARLAQMKRLGMLAGVRPDDVVANLFPLTSIPHQGFLSALYGSLGAGAKMVAAFTGRGYPEFMKGRDTDEAIDFLEPQAPTVLWGITTFVRRFVLRAQERRADFSKVRLVFAMGEPCPRGFREDLRTRVLSLGPREVSIQNGYGFTEMQGPTYECEEGGPRHLPYPELFHLEILHPETHKPVPDGEEGLVVISHLNRRGTVLLRYQVGDISAIRRDVCPQCGRAGERFVRMPHRAGGLLKVKGTLINPGVVDDLLSHLPGVEEYQCVIAKSDPREPYSEDELRIRIACAPEARTALASSVREQVRNAIEVTPRVEFLSRDELVGDDARYKFKRWKDERPQEMDSPSS